MAALPAARQGMVDPAIFADLQAKIDEASAVREELRDVVNELEKHDRNTQAMLSRAHSTPTQQLASVTGPAEESISEQIETIRKLAAIASKHPYYKYNQIWSRQMQDSCFSILWCGWLGGFHEMQSDSVSNLLTIEQVGSIMKVPVNLKDRDDFHLTIEEYLHSLISLVEELSRLARNAVTLSDYQRPLQISRFIKDLHAGFSILNLKNDTLRRRSDGLKYKIKEVEDVVYDLSLRNLVPRAS